MSTHKISRFSQYLLTALYISTSACLLVSIASIFLTTHAQTSPCPSSGLRSWMPGTTVYVDFGNITDADQIAQLQAAINNWNDNNVNQELEIAAVENKGLMESAFGKWQP